MSILSNSFFIMFMAFIPPLLTLGLMILAAMALWKYIRSNNHSEKDLLLCKSLGEVLKTHRIQANMTQEFVAERIGVSRQAVSKWESGKSDPSTTNLFALAKLFQITPEQLMKEIQSS